MVLRPRPSCYTELMSRTSWLDRWTIDYRRGSESISVCLFQDRLTSRVVLAPCYFDVDRSLNRKRGDLIGQSDWQL